MRSAPYRCVLATLLLIAAWSALLSAQGVPTLIEEPAAAAAASEGPLPPSNALDKDDLAFYVRHLYTYDDRLTIDVSDPVESPIADLLEITVTASYRQASREHVFLVSRDGRHLIEGRTFEIDKNPFHDVNQTIDTLPAPAFGQEGASVVVVVYSDFQCPYCAKEAQVLRTQLKNEYEDRVRVYFKDYPLPNHDWAFDAALAGRCVYAQEPQAFWDFHDWIFEQQENVTKTNLSAKVAEFAAEHGLDAEALQDCQADEATTARVRASIDEGKAVGVQSTPTLFVNGRRLSGALKWEQLQAILDYELEYQEVTHNAGDDCGCSAEVAFPE